MRIADIPQHIEKQLAKEKPFAIWRMPYAKNAQFLFQKNNTDYRFAKTAPSGFIASDFLQSHRYLIPENQSDALFFPADHLDFMQNTVRILSGLYGILRPLDQMQAYRLEMGTQLKVGQSKNLYEFWQEKITHELKEELVNDEVLVNLASQEYAKSVDFKAINQTIIQPQFKDFKKGKLKTIPFYAKKARGMMTRFIVDHQISDKDQLKNFNYADYAFSEEHTEKAENPVFIR